MTIGGSSTQRILLLTDEIVKFFRSLVEVKYDLDDESYQADQKYDFDK